MRAADKKPRSREAFAAVFEEQTRRFSAFELLGLSSDAAPPSPTLPSPAQDAEPEWLAGRDEPFTTGPDRPLGPDPSAQALQPNRQGAVQSLDSPNSSSTLDLRPSSSEVITRPAQALRPDRQGQELLPEGPAVDQTLDPQQDQTVDGLVLGQTVRPRLGQTTDLFTSPDLAPLGPDPHPFAGGKTVHSTLLAPLQWAVWQVLQEADTAGQVTSYRTIAKRTNSTIDGVRKAIRVLEKERVIVRKETVRTAEEQGFRVAVNPGVTVRRGTLSEAKAILKRGLSLGQTPDRQGQMLGPDGLRLYVCKNINIRQTDLTQLLRMSPPEWKIREQTLVQIAEALPEMTAIEFRLSLTYLIEQAKHGKEEIRNPNAWVKAAFEKNRRPLVTEREIEARFAQSRSKPAVLPETKGEEGQEEVQLFRRYLASSPQDRAAIDRMAEAKATLLLKVVSADKHAGVMEAARLEAVRAYFAQKS